MKAISKLALACAISLAGISTGAAFAADKFVVAGRKAGAVCFDHQGQR
ncbi:hypothetical protein [Rhizobium leguminosarum]|nr:hypothetical protein [Rhizobium leguminosarum]